jgi:hypothetical protein
MPYRVLTDKYINILQGTDQYFCYALVELTNKCINVLQNTDTNVC